MSAIAPSRDPEADDLEFWRIETVMAKVGLSRSEIYRRVQRGEFPRSYPYPGAPRHRFWLNNEVRDWQRRTLDAIIEGLLQ